MDVSDIQIWKNAVVLHRFGKGSLVGSGVLTRGLNREL